MEDLTGKDISEVAALDLESLPPLVIVNWFKEFLGLNIRELDRPEVGGLLNIDWVLMTNPATTKADHTAISTILGQAASRYPQGDDRNVTLFDVSEKHKQAASKLQEE